MNILPRSCFAFGLVFAFLTAAVAQSADPKLLLEIPDDGETREIPLDPAQPLSILATGDLSARAAAGFSCSDEEPCPECPPCEGVQVSMAGADGSFTVSPSTVTQGGNVTFSWTSRGAWECRGSDLPQGSPWNTFVGVPNGSSGTISTAGLAPGTYQPRITCSNGPTTATRTVSLTVNPPGGGLEGCENRPPPTQMSRATQCLWGFTSPVAGVDCTQWTGLFGNPFPQTTSVRQFFLDPGRYLALEFNTGNYTGNRVGTLTAFEPQFGSPTTFGPGRIITTISRCPGDFNRDLISAEPEGAACYNAFGPVEWATQTYSGALPRCRLAPNTRYFFNVVFSNSPAGTAPNSLVWWCDTNATSRCGRLLQVLEQ